MLKAKERKANSLILWKPKKRHLKNPRVLLQRQHRGMKQLRIKLVIQSIYEDITVHVACQNYRFMQKYGPKAGLKKYMEKQAELKKSKKSNQKDD